VIDRRAFLGTLAGGLLAAPLAVAAQQAGKVPKIGYLGSGYAGASPAGLVEAFKQGLREHGYIDGQNIAIEWRFAEGRFERIPALTAELVRLKVALIFAVNPETAVPAKNVTKVIPIVFAAGDPIASGLVASLARPGGNVTGLSTNLPGIGAKRLELLKEAIPKVLRVAVLSNPANPGHPIMLKEMDVAAHTLKVELQRLEARSPNDFKGAFQAATQGRVEGFIALDDGLFFSERVQIVALVARSRLPAVYGFRETAEAGGLMVYGANLRDQWRRAASYVDKILKGAKPADLPVEQPTKFELIINLKTAKALGLTIPPSLLQRADQVIE
jgi:putative ABC transport system substrate-binding protein